MNRVLELSKKIYESGFEPDMTARSPKGSTNIYLTIGKPDMKKDIKSFFNIYPWFSADWCWQILPKKIKVNIEYEALTGEYYYKKELQEIFLINNFIGYPIHSIEIKNTLQEALLELVCWCIDNGHIKVVK